MTASTIATDPSRARMTASTARRSPGMGKRDLQMPSPRRDRCAGGRCEGSPPAQHRGSRGHRARRRRSYAFQRQRQARPGHRRRVFDPATFRPRHPRDRAPDRHSQGRQRQAASHPCRSDLAANLGSLAGGARSRRNDELRASHGAEDPIPRLSRGHRRLTARSPTLPHAHAPPAAAQRHPRPPRGADPARPPGWEERDDERPLTEEGRRAAEQLATSWSRTSSHRPIRVRIRARSDT